MTDDSSDRPDYYLRFSDWPMLLAATPEPVRAEHERLQRRMLRLEREIAALRRAGVPEPGQSHPAASAATGPFPEDEPEPPRPPAWADWLAATPEPVRQDLERLTRLIENLCQELAALRRRDLLPQSLRASPTASSLPLPVAPPEQVAAVCRRFGIASMKAFGSGSTGQPEDRICILFVTFEPGIDPATVDQDDIQRELSALYGREISVRFL
ncbi:MAG: hypothetical protein OZSIB_2493 [Candidatus Ozemobacter sibiricus]|uniref:Uncharacterized protein n=1 Tax=Candidatus Ozemobacter sibiricus TaxID=2268124 RepID=A0A367ZSV3_9BACT|nr:MAG: hypothetical protein OZSIB_2493 [Candidatus Ozemobacter sibiricus]